MNKKLGAFLYTAVLLGTVSSVFADDITINQGEIRDFDTNQTINGTVTNDGTMNNSAVLSAISTLTNNTDGTINNNGTIDIDSLTSSGEITNSGSIIADTISTTGAISGTGSITIGEGSIGGAVTQSTITITGSSLTNNNTITASNTFTNSAEITGSGSLVIKDGSSTADISQTNVSVTGNFENNAIVEATSQFTNTGNISGDNGTISIAGGSNSGSISQKDVTITGNFINNDSISSTGTFNNSGSITGTGNLSVNDGQNTGNITQDEISISGAFTNSSSITTGSLVVASTSSITGTDGILEVKTNTSNEGSISQKNITLSGTTNNTGSIESTELFTNNSVITGSGNLSVKDGSSSGSITQDNITISGNFQNNAALQADTKLTNSGSVTNTSNIIAAEMDNQSGAVISGNTGSLKIGSGSNAGTISQNIVENTGTLENTGSITALDTFSNSGTITGTTGVLNIKNGTNTGSITQDIITVTGNLTNTTGRIIAESITNTGEIALNEGSSLTINNQNGELGGTISTLGNGNSLDTGADITGTVKIGDGSTVSDLELKSGNITSAATVNLTSNGTLNINNSSSTVTMDNSDIWNGTLQLTDGTLNVSGRTSNGTLVAEGGKLDLQSGTLNINTGSSIAGAVETIIETGSTLNIAGGETTLDSSDTWNGAVNMASGTLTVDGISDNGKLTASGGVLDIKNSVLDINTGSSIASAVETKIESTSTLNIAGGNVTLNNNDDWQGTVNLQSGTLTVDNLTDNGKLSASGGIIDIKNGTLKVTTDSSIAEAVTTKINTGTTLNITGGEVAIDNSDLWNGTIDLDTGSLTINGRSDNGAIVADGGSLDLQSGALKVTENSSIAGAVDLTIAENSTLNIQGGSVVLNDGDNWTGSIILGTEGIGNDNSSLTVGLPSGSSAGILQANNGSLEVLNGLNLDIKDGSYIKEAVAITTSGNINIQNGGEVAIDDNDTLSGAAKVTLTDGGTLNYGKTQDASAIIEADGGNLNLLANSQLTLTAGSHIADAVALDIQKDATLTLKDSLTLNLDNEDTWNGKIINENGIINTNGVTKSSDSASLIQSNGELNIYNDSSITLGSNSEISGGDINITTGTDGTNGSVLTVVDANITGGNMTIDENSSFVVKSGTFNLDSLTSSNLVDVMNNQINQSSIETLTAVGQADFNIDIHARSNKNTSNDTFVVGTLAGNGTVMVNDWALQGDIYGWDAPIDRHITLSDIFVDANGNPLEGNIEVTQDTTFTPIGWYQLNKNAGASGINYTLDLVKYNPQVYRGQVTTIAQWMNQLNIDDMLFTHSMVLPSFKDPDGGTMANRYAATSPLYAPYQYSRKDGGVWYKMYGTFENLQMNNNVGRVGNNAYGALIGADFGLKELRNGWKFMPTAYIGYNGAHQTFAKVGAYQNGGQAGFLGTWYKDNFILGAMAYGGIYDNSMDVHGNTDNTFNYFGGGAAKAAYNIRLHRDLVLQPNLFVSYNYFGQQNWHSNFGQMGMMAGDLNGVNIAPGLNLIWEKDTFSSYLTLQYMYNVNGAVGGRAGNVGLPQMEMERGYIQYGIGFTKKFTDRASGYLQAVLRNVGRTGVGFQMGFNFFLGK